MAASALEISRWFARGVTEGHTYMVVVCDTWDHSDYPIYCKDAEEARKKANSPGSMQRTMEVYDLSESWASQSIGRVWNLPRA